MTFDELKLAVAGDCHRENYSDDLITRFIHQGEALIRSRLDAYGLEYIFTDADRVDPLGAVYTLPARVSVVRQIICNHIVLDQVDESQAQTWRNSTTVAMYAMRPSTIIFAGVPGELSAMTMVYMGLPAPFVDPTDTNALIVDYPQLYIDAAATFVFRRAQDYDSAQAAFSSVNSVIDQINRKMHKQLGGARPSTPYNVAFRSSY